MSHKSIQQKKRKQESKSSSGIQQQKYKSGVSTICAIFKNEEKKKAEQCKLLPYHTIPDSL